VQKQLLTTLADRHPSLTVSLFDALWQNKEAPQGDLLDTLFSNVLNNSILDVQAIQLLDRLSSISLQLSSISL